MNLLDNFKGKKVGVYDAECGAWRPVSKITIDNGFFQDIEYDEVDACSRYDAYILPGFIDAHCHLFENPFCTDSFSIDKENELDSSEMYYVASKNVITACEAGITSVKDLGGRFYHSIEVAKRLNENLGASRIFTSGCYYTSKGGHCSNRGGVVIVELNDFIHGLDYLKSQEIRFCKLIHGDDGFNQQMLLDMVNEAHKRGMIVSCHAYTEKAARDAVDAKVDILEHAGDYSEDLLEQIKRKGIIIVPTFVAAYDGLNGCSVLPDVNNTILRKWYWGEKKVISKLFKKGIKVALGTDCGFDGTLFNSLIREIKLLKNAVPWVSIEKLLYSAFIITPQTIGMQNQMGKIEKGYFSDFQVYYNNPLDDLDILGHPASVWVNGNEVYRIIDSNDVVFRNLKKSDVNYIMKYIRHPYFDCDLSGDFWTRKEIDSWLSEEEDYCVGAFLSNQLIGFCLSHFHSEVNKVHLENIFVAETYRDRGIGYRLLNEVVHHYQGNNNLIRYVGLVDVDNAAACRLLRKADFNMGSKLIWMQKNG